MVFQTARGHQQASSGTCWSHSCSVGVPTLSSCYSPVFSCSFLILLAVDIATSITTTNLSLLYRVVYQTASCPSGSPTFAVLHQAGNLWSNWQQCSCIPSSQLVAFLLSELTSVVAHTWARNEQIDVTFESWLTKGSHWSNAEIKHLFKVWQVQIYRFKLKTENSEVHVSCMTCMMMYKQAGERGNIALVRKGQQGLLWPKGCRRWSRDKIIILFCLDLCLTQPCLTGNRK